MVLADHSGSCHGRLSGVTPPTGGVGTAINVRKRWASRPPSSCHHSQACGFPLTARMCSSTALWPSQTLRTVTWPAPQAGTCQPVVLASAALPPSCRATQHSNKGSGGQCQSRQSRHTCQLQNSATATGHSASAADTAHSQATTALLSNKAWPARRTRGSPAAPVISVQWDERVAGANSVARSRPCPAWLGRLGRSWRADGSGRAPCMGIAWALHGHC